MPMRSVKADRVKACELAAQVMQGCGNDGPYGPRLMALTIFFENYISAGCEKTEQMMRLLNKPRGRFSKNFRVIAGGNL